ncbi:hypothetical protein NADFUDRAFT_68824 [Nadsonia fulvescens var. elongata DSM 6958]|uniref:SWR1-complex protein 4 n=1 Tax=Nadsonia fulvescens var. elongata DSM 6958 TaxID=857566 RepID=A0A1E3PTS2_9ASCO|nr:hypothetical protein NADFUDRAFT_68824 [Nadsonia fulvescens var. elongata DSM 6958]
MQKPTPWHWRSFINPARSDTKNNNENDSRGLTLHHWVRGEGQYDRDQDGTEVDYAFAKFDTKALNETLNTTEIAKTPNPVDLSETERGWTYEETRYLFELCSDYDLRWVVIYDRYDYKSPQPRVMEDLKERYYYVMYRLGQSTVSNSLSADTNNTIPAMNAVGMSSSPSPLFPREAELKRKQYLERLLQRSPSEVAEEEALVIKSRKLEAASKRMLAERADLLHLLDAPQASASVNQYQSSQGLSQFASSLLSADKNKKKKISKVAKKLSAKEEAAYGISYHDKLVPVGVFLRSSKLTAFKPAVAAKVAATLAELGVPPKPVMPTAKVCAKFESVLHSIGVLLEAKKQVDKLETELKILKSKK